MYVARCELFAVSCSVCCCVCFVVHGLLFDDCYLIVGVVFVFVTCCLDACHLLLFVVCCLLFGVVCCFLFLVCRLLFMVCCLLLVV